ncbi:MAG: TldD/PmbA family protein, partial [Candidatus Riflebacteria bacterium]|nr:TldD/PmbA family protein [Candidatus Riflebacteria bacterium]
MSNPSGSELMKIARTCVERSLAKGAREAAAASHETSEVTVKWRDGKPEEIKEATTRGVVVHLYVDDRYSSGTTSDLRPEALAEFVDRAIAMARALVKDPLRSLADPSLYAGQAKVDLRLEDPGYEALTPEGRTGDARQIEEGARSVAGAKEIVSVTGTVADRRGISCRFHSNGFSGEHRDTFFSASAEVTVRDAGGRRPDEWASAGARLRSERPAAADQGRLAAERALARRGARKISSAVLPMAVENRCAARLLQAMLGPLSGPSLQQKKSFLDGKLGVKIASGLLTWMDDPLLPGGLASRLFDGEGLATRKRPIIEAGVLRSYFIDTYYGKKLKLAPTSGGPSNATLTGGGGSRAQLLALVGDGILVTDFLGGNSNDTTGEFSLGVMGFRVKKGQLAEPVTEMNISGNLATFFE